MLSKTHSHLSKVLFMCVLLTQTAHAANIVAAESTSRHSTTSVASTAHTIRLAAAPAPPGGINLALRRPYTMQPAPNYERTSDHFDVTQLTDGKTASAPLWMHTEAIGWEASRPVTITIDLQQPRTIASVNWHTGAGTADVAIPEAIYLFTSTDGVRYGYVGDLLSAQKTATASRGNYNEHTLSIVFVAIEARFVRFVVDRAGPYVFVDEVEVFGPDASMSSESSHVIVTRPTPPDHASTTTNDTSDLFWSKRAQRRAALAVELDNRRIADLISKLESSVTTRGALLNQLSQATAEALKTAYSKPVVSSRLPLSDAHASMYRIAANAESSKGRSTLIAWPTNPWDPLNPLDASHDLNSGILATALMPGERRWVAFNVRNSSAASISLGILVELPGLAPNEVKLFRANWTGTDDSTWAAAELEPISGGDSTNATLLPGVTQQFLIELSPARTAKGDIVGSIVLSTSASTRIRLPIKVHLFKTTFPNNLSTQFSGWDYTDESTGYAVTPANRNAIQQLLQTHAVDSPWATNRVMNWDRFDGFGHPTTQATTAPLKKWLSEWPTARRYRIFVAVSDHFAGIPMSDARFSKAVVTWANFWASTIRQQGKSPDQFDLLLVDEPRTRSDAATTVAWAKAIRSSGAAFRIWVNPLASDPRQVPASMIEAADTIAIHIQTAQEGGTGYWNWARNLVAQGKSVEVYGTNGPARVQDPYSYYRLASWRAFSLGASGVSFWSFTDTRGSTSDNEFAGRDFNYSPLFINSGPQIRSGKQLEADLEGLEDIEYLKSLQSLSANNQQSQVRTAAKTLLQEVSAMLRAEQSADFKWQIERARTQADDIRTRIGELLDSADR